MADDGFQYKVLDRGLDNVKDVRKEGLDEDEHVREVVRRNWKGGDEGSWIYGYNVSGEERQVHGRWLTRDRLRMCGRRARMKRTQSGPRLKCRPMWLWLLSQQCPECPLLQCVEN